jgi:GTP-binding protein LepA
MFHYDIKLIRNFSIIAHIDHGKSTIADRLLQLTGTIADRDMQEQVLDNMDLERERGITIKAHPVTMTYKADDGKIYQINFIDTPGHVDFTYEVSRSLSACEGALLVVDAVQGVQAQSLANVHLAIERNLEILPVINKIDLPSADVESVKQQIEDVIGLDTSTTILCSAKMGTGIKEILESILIYVPAPKAPTDDILRALIFDSHYDTYRGVMVYIRVISGSVTKKSMVNMMFSGKTFEVLEVGIFTPSSVPVEELRPGEVGYVIANIKNTSDVKIGDTLTSTRNPALEPLPGFRVITPVVYAGIYPVDSSDFEMLRDALYKLQLNDSALHVEQESSMALGFGFRCGFLGLLHLEIVFERLQRHFNLDIITTAPSVIYKFTLTNGTHLEIDNVAHYPDPAHIQTVEEPWVKCHIMAPSEYLGAIMSLGMDKRGSLEKT